MLELDGLTRRFGDVVALDDLSFSVAPGRKLGFVGPNGAGKTTAMRIVLGVLAADAGTVRWNGGPIDGATRSRFGYMPEERGLYPKMRVREQLVYFARLHGMDAAAAAAAADRWIERLGLTARAGDRVETLSLGNQQRVQLGVALVHDPELLVLDEPFSGLDPTGVDVMSGVLRERAAAGVPVVFSSHQLELVERLCEDVAIVKDGRIVASGAVAELRERGREERRAGARPRRGRRRRRVGRRRAGRRGRRDRPARRARAAARRRRPRRGPRRGPRVRHGHALQPRAADARRPLPPGRGRMSGREAVALVARREVSQRVREKSFLVGTGVSLVIIVLVVVLPSVLGFGGTTEYTIAVQDPAKAADRRGGGRAGRRVRRRGEDRARRRRGRRRRGARRATGSARQEEPDDELLSILQAANAKVRERARAASRRASTSRRPREALNPPPLALSTVEPVSEGEDRAGFAFFAVLLLYGQLIGIGIFVAMGVVEEKSSRVVELLLVDAEAHAPAGREGDRARPARARAAAGDRGHRPGRRRGIGGASTSTATC